MLGKHPTYIGTFRLTLTEVMYYLYLPVRMRDADSVGRMRLPPNLEVLRELIATAEDAGRAWQGGQHFRYTYVSARKGWATPDSPLNRPGWHCDGYGTDDLNFVWWTGPGTRFAIQPFVDVSFDHTISLRQFEAQIDPLGIVQPDEKQLFMLDAEVVHATPVIAPPGCMRQYVKVSLSNERYNLYGNSHNYLFDYEWPMVDRENVRNDTYSAQKDYPTPSSKG